MTPKRRLARRLRVFSSLAKINVALTSFQLPAGESLRARKSAIRSIFTRCLIPGIEPSPEDYATALCILRQKPGAALACCYCGDAATEWDHLRPVMRNGTPTGALSIIQNLVPACSKCNQSKGNRHWHEWITGEAPLSPATRGVRRLRRKIGILRRYEQWGEGLDGLLAGRLDQDLLSQHWASLDEVLAILDRADRDAAKLRQTLAETLPERLPAPRQPSFWAKIFGRS